MLSAFSALALPGPRAAPPPVVEAWSAWEPDWRDREYAEGKGDPFESEPWRHNWAREVDGVLRWTGVHWELLSRFSWKTYPQAARCPRSRAPGHRAAVYPRPKRPRRGLESRSGVAGIP